MDRAHPILMIYFISLGIYGIAEIFLQLRYSQWKTRSRDRSYLLIMVPFFLVLYLSPVEYLQFGYPLHRFPVFLGFLVLLTGVAVRIAAMVTLRRNFSVAIKQSDQNQLVVNGIYRYIRHPLYLALLIISCSGCIVFICRLAWILVVVLLAGILVRIRKEESLLEKQYPGYAEYRGKSRKLLPFIF
jgi:protein-S-isoprenylcysteine O-methyltransferase Ste14